MKRKENECRGALFFNDRQQRSKGTVQDATIQYVSAQHLPCHESTDLLELALAAQLGEVDGETAGTLSTHS